MVERRRWRVGELAIIRVLDEHGRGPDDFMAGQDGVSVRDVRDTRIPALLTLPKIAKAADEGT